MRTIVDLVDSLTGTVRFVIGALLLCGFGIVLLMTVGASVVAPQVADKFAERAENIGEKAIDAAREEARNRELARDGWGYSDSGSSRDAAGDEVGGWGDSSD